MCFVSEVVGIQNMHKFTHCGCQFKVVLDEVLSFHAFRFSIRHRPLVNITVTRLKIGGGRKVTLLQRKYFK